MRSTAGGSSPPARRWGPSWWGSAAGSVAAGGAGGWGGVEGAPARGGRAPTSLAPPRPPVEPAGGVFLRGGAGRGGWTIFFGVSKYLVRPDVPSRLLWP